MGSSNGRESCGRCSFSTVLDAVGAGEDEGKNADAGEERDADGSPRRDALEGGRIEVGERDLRIASTPAVLAGRAKRRLDEAAERLIYGR